MLIYLCLKFLLAYMFSLIPIMELMEINWLITWIQLNYLGGFPGDGLKDLFGVISEEIDTLYPSDRNRVHFAEMPEGEVRDYAEVLRVTDGTNAVSYTHLWNFRTGSICFTNRMHGEKVHWPLFCG